MAETIELENGVTVGNYLRGGKSVLIDVTGDGYIAATHLTVGELEALAKDEASVEFNDS